jgi:3-keto-5-aminohexanoate cleavage enzyme
MRGSPREQEEVPGKRPLIIAWHHCRWIFSVRAVARVFGDLMQKKLIITVRVNEYMSRAVNPNVPFTPEEIAETAAECRAAGASIIHFHARRPEIYAEIVARIREKTDILIDSTLGQITVQEDENRLAHVRLMGQKSTTRPDFAAVDTGSSNIDAYDPAQKKFLTTDKVYLNSTETCLFLARGMTEAGVKPHLSVWAVPFVRMVDAFLDMGAITEPAYVQCVLAEGGIVGAHPCTTRGLEALIDFLPPQRRIEWTVACKEGNLFNVASTALERGGHLAPGIGDYPYPELGCPTNADLVRRFAELGQAMGRGIASTDEARAMLGIARS